MELTEDNNQDKISINENKEAWNKVAYEAWIQKYGEPTEAAKKIQKNPLKSLSVLGEKFGDVSNKRILNLMGSNGSKAVALALMGAEVTVVDFSEGNRRYAMEMADAAGIKIEYLLSDVLKLTDDVLNSDYDIVFAEMGILHYFLDLSPFMNIVFRALKSDGLFVVRDFHPVTTKLISSRGTTAKIRKHKVTGDYFSTTLEESDIAYSKHLTEAEPIKVLLRKWNIGEIVTAVADSGLIIKSLTEEPNLSCEVFDKGIPKSFTLTARK
ncbi:class I SAM-dependent methyltransferase [Alkaliphilus transvaalensis]|uniref:class I SAM-dependent methyltransferase n=1 Tax=Alkaliphilus transvaalensis TaxID=114628 RepID=UPI000479C1A4|nr:class I SAM-dependent methyltransferase [Alkaliphilus transvaalensis]